MKLLLLITVIGVFSQNIFAKESKWEFTLEGGAAYQSLNDVQIPGDTGTRFSLVDAIGKGPIPYVRFESKVRLSAKHKLRLLIAPLAIEETGQLNKTINYDDNTFAANTDTTYRYQFNSYRFTYAYQIFRNPNWTWDIGFTAKIRDAEIKLTQGNTESGYPNIGFVPLIHTTLERQISDKWQAKLDLDGIASPYGRAIDLGLFANYSVNNNWKVGAGYRTIEGGANNDKVYTFAWLHYFGAQIGYTY